MSTDPLSSIEDTYLNDTFHRSVSRSWRYFMFFFSLELALIGSKLVADKEGEYFWPITIAGVGVGLLWGGFVFLERRFAVNRSRTGTLGDEDHYRKLKRYAFTVFLLNLSVASAFMLYWIFEISTNRPESARYTGQTAAVNRYFEKIRNNEALLTAFFSGMPKGGDLHNHYSGSVYAEAFWDYMILHDYYINTQTLEVVSPHDLVSKKKGAKKASLQFQRCSKLKAAKQLDNIKQRIFQDWSSKDYYPALMASDKHFFDAFGKFSPALDTVLDKGLLELKDRAKTEHVQYIELMLSGIRSLPLNKELVKYNEILRGTMTKQDTTALNALFNTIKSGFEKQNIYSYANAFCRSLESYHHRLRIDDSSFNMRYLTYCNRNAEPVDVLRQLLQAFYAANKDSLVVGVNILSPEDGAVSMSDYKLQMRMFRYCHSLFPGVKYSMHAGELTLGLVKPEDLTFHINDAIHTAGAARIGHGVDMAYETNSYQLLRYMHDKNIAIEINLSSNDFILNVRDDAHPISLYYNFKVPIVISTDDAGILRTNIVRQYVLLAKRYKFVSYGDIKQFVLNSIKYSFIKNEALKQGITHDINARFDAFEKDVAAVN